MNEAPQPLTILYFARLGEQLRCRQESLELPAGISNAGELREFLAQRGERWYSLLDSNVRIAVDQEIVSTSAPVAPGAEVAFFPPVTGG